MFEMFAFFIFSFQLLVLGDKQAKKITINPVYEEKTARRFFDLAAASYLGDDTRTTQCFEKLSWDYDYSMQTAQSAVCDELGNECQMYVAYSAMRNNYVIAFSGINASIWSEEISFSNKYDPFITASEDSEGNVEYYFNKGVQSLWETIVGHTGTSNKDTTFYITGHSFGGAMASITAARLYLEDRVSSKEKIQLITFGQPRTWDHDAAETFKRWVPYASRVVHYKDPIPMKGNQCSNELATEGKVCPYHHTQEIWYNDDFTSYDPCSTDDGEDTECSAGLSQSGSIYEHFRYFGVNITEYAASGCSVAPTTTTTHFPYRSQAAFGYSMHALFILMILRLVFK